MASNLLSCKLERQIGVPPVPVLRDNIGIILVSSVCLSTVFTEDTTLFAHLQWLGVTTITETFVEESFNVNP